MLCTINTGALIVKAISLSYSPYSPPVWLLWAWTHRLSVYHPQPLPRTWCQMRHTESLVDGACSVTSPHASCSSGIKAVVLFPWEVLLPPHNMEDISTQLASWAPLKALPWALPGTPLFWINYLCILVISCIVVTVPVDSARIAPHQNSVPGDCFVNLSAFAYWITVP